MNKITEAGAKKYVALYIPPTLRQKAYITGIRGIIEYEWGAEKCNFSLVLRENGHFVFRFREKGLKLQGSVDPEMGFPSWIMDLIHRADFSV